MCYNKQSKLLNRKEPKMKMSITRALVELKNLDNKIKQAIQGVHFIGVTTGKDNNKKVFIPSGNDVASAQQLIQGNFDKATQLISNRQRIKAAVVKSNAVTEVKLAGKLLTVAEAIETKTSLPYKELLLTTLVQQANSANTHVSNINNKMNEDIDKALQVVYGNEKGKVQSEMYEQVAEPQRKQKEGAILDPAKIDLKIKSLQDEIQTIKSELDFVLAESNAKTEIEVDIG